ncbi:MAG: PRC-barrel domain-containing protein [Pseudomonadota bacterium]|nr:PRC-barrel domain-containing protein [Pseudomonadota bacterium]
MLRSVKDLEGYAVGASDGTIGHIKDFYFDDEAWVVRYLIVDAGAWLASRMVLVSPVAIGRAEWADRLLHVQMTKDQVRNSPDVDTNKPVSRQHEMDYADYYGYPYYWGGAGYWGGGMYPNLMMPGYGGYGSPRAIRSEEQSAYARSEEGRRLTEDPHLRSCRAVMKYDVHASDGDIGHVDGFLVDDSTWAVRYLVVNTSNWWLGHRVLVAPQWIEDVDWFASKVSVALTRQAIKDAPAYDPERAMDRGLEVGLYGHYGRPGYWAEDARRWTQTSRI